MAKVSTYLNFAGNTEQAFTFYKAAFQSEFDGAIRRYGDMPAQPGQPPMPDEMRRMVMHIELPILGGHLLMGTDAPESMGFSVKHGNGVWLSLDPDSRAEADRLFAALGEGGTVEMPLAEMFWGGYFGTLADRFGVRWMVNCTAKL